jgi:hypothetical protein
MRYYGRCGSCGRRRTLPVGSSARDFGDMHKCKDYIKLDFMKYDMMCSSALIRPRAGHEVKMHST